MSAAQTSAAGTAQSFAEETAKELGSTARRVIDAEYGDACWLAFEKPNCAIVYYEDDPQCQVSVGNRDGRFIDAPLAAAKTGGA